MNTKVFFQWKSLKGDLMKKIARFLVGVKSEMKKVRWPDKKKMVENSTATLSFILVFAVFFAVLDLILSLIKTVI